MSDRPVFRRLRTLRRTAYVDAAGLARHFVEPCDDGWSWRTRLSTVSAKSDTSREFLEAYLERRLRRHGFDVDTTNVEVSA